MHPSTRLKLATGLLLVALVLTAPASAQTLRLMHWEHDRATIDAFEAIAAQFEATHPGVDIQIEFVPVENINVKLITEARAGNLPDIIQLQPEQMFLLADAGMLNPLNGLVNEIGQDHFVPGAFGATTYNGQIYGIPSQIVTWSLWARGDLLADAGLTAPTSWEDMINVAQRLTVDQNGDGTPERYGLALPYSRIVQAQEYLIAHIWQNGGSLFTEDFEVAFDSPEAIGALEHYRSLKPYMPPSMSTVNYAELGQIYANGDAAMAYYPGRITSHIERVNPAVGDATIALNPPYQAEPATWVWAKMLVSPKGRNSKLAQEFIKFFIQPENMARVALTVPIHSVPTVQGVYAHPDFMADPMNAKYASALQTQQSILQYGRDASSEFGSPNPYYAYVAGSFSVLDALQAVMIDGRDPAAVAREVAREMRELVRDLK